MSKSTFPDPFAAARTRDGVGEMVDQGDPVKMVLGHRDVRKCAHGWQSFQSGAVPGRIVVPSEEKIRDTRQIPFEVDPPEHGAYRALLEDWFKRPNGAEYTAQLARLIREALAEARSRESLDVVSEFALPLQSRALTLLLNEAPGEAETWIAWGTHVFRSEGESLDGDKANILYDYLDQRIEKARAQPGEDLYSVLLQADFKERKLSTEEIRGVMILTFAGGRDTVINAVTNTISYFAEHTEALALLRKDPSLVNTAVEELVRYFAPLTHMGRVATKDTAVCEHAVKQDSRISLCWASANRDERVFEQPDEVILDRKRNPHVSFGFGTHNCLGATHARQLLRTLVRELATADLSITLGKAEENIEEWGEFRRKVGFHRLEASFK
ncbi:MAG: cytochrome P450 [Bacteroidota bacterium]